MKKVILVGLGLIMMGCSAFDIQYAERIVCENGKTPWANKTEIAINRISWYVNQSGWRSKKVSGSYFCRIEEADIERWNKCEDGKTKCKMHPKKKPVINQPKIESIEPPEKGIIASL